jgi:hypothetical protein
MMSSKVFYVGERMIDAFSLEMKRLASPTLMGCSS